MIDFKVQHLFRIQNQKRNQGTLIETGRNRPVSRNQTAILAGTLKSNPDWPNVNNIQYQFSDMDSICISIDIEI